MGGELSVPNTDLNLFLVPATTPNKPADFHFFRVPIQIYTQKPIRRSRCLDIDVKPV
jgi:hypothetical protein